MVLFLLPIRPDLKERLSRTGLSFIAGLAVMVGSDCDGRTQARSWAGSMRAGYAHLLGVGRPRILPARPSQRPGGRRTLQRQEPGKFIRQRRRPLLDKISPK